jgi:hypothetical protein
VPWPRHEPMELPEPNRAGGATETDARAGSDQGPSSTTLGIVSSRSGGNLQRPTETKQKRSYRLFQSMMTSSTALCAPSGTVRAAAGQRGTEQLVVVHGAKARDDARDISVPLDASRRAAGRTRPLYTAQAPSTDADDAARRRLDLVGSPVPPADRFEAEVLKVASVSPIGTRREAEEVVHSLRRISQRTRSLQILVEKHVSSWEQARCAALSDDAESAQVLQQKQNTDTGADAPRKGLSDPPPRVPRAETGGMFPQLAPSAPCEVWHHALRADSRSAACLAREVRSVGACLIRRCGRASTSPRWSRRKQPSRQRPSWVPMAPELGSASPFRRSKQQSAS